MWTNKDNGKIQVHGYQVKVYSIPCNDCNQEYIGQTKRQFGIRLKEHQKAVSLSKRDTSALSEHTCQTNHTIAWDNSKSITTNRRYHQRRCLEAWHINSAHAPLNRDDGGFLPDAYLHLINRWCHYQGRALKVKRYSAKITPDEDTRPECYIMSNKDKFCSLSSLF